MDLDIEEAVDVSVPVRLLQALNSDMGSNFILTMTPVASALTGGGNLSGFSYFDVDSQAVDGNGNKLVNWYNTQFYSGFGSASDPSTYQSIVAAGWDPNRVVMGVLDSTNDGDGFVDINTLKNTISSIKSQYENFGGVYGWEYWDAGTNDGLSDPAQWVQSVGSAVFGS
jgi:hypothetical protein